MKINPRRKLEIVDKDEYLELVFPTGERMLFDREDLELIKKIAWRLTPKQNRPKYVRASKRIAGKNVSLVSHRLILGLTDSKVMVDHINGDGLDNRKQNLRIVSNSQNQANRKPHNGKQFKGVRRLTGTKEAWLARITVHKKLLYLGTFPSQTSALEAYNTAAIKYFGEYARLNDIQKEQPENEA